LLKDADWLIVLARTPLIPNCFKASDGVPPADLAKPRPTTATSVRGSNVRNKRKARAPASTAAPVRRLRSPIAYASATT